MTSSPDLITSLLDDWRRGGAEAAGELLPLVYGELRLAARRALESSRWQHTLQPTALVHEAYLRIEDRGVPIWQNRSHFYAAAARMMRHILVDSIRRRTSRKRGGDVRSIPLEEACALHEGELGADRRGPDLLALDAALEALAEVDPRKAKIVELRFFGGLTIAEVAAAVGLSTATTHREWRRARAWLYRELDHAGG